jgi:ATP-binding cassette subfamily B protein
MPIMQQGYSSFAQIRGEQYSFVDAIELLYVNTSKSSFFSNNSNSLTLNTNLELRNIDFSYPGSNKKLFNDLNLIITKGERLGIVGETGCGKSTLLDIVMGLIRPDSGGLYLNGSLLNYSNYPEWRMNIAHVPQHIFLIDSSIKENIALGENSNQIDMELVESACKQARIHDFIITLPSKYDSFVGERGIRLSGGQKQRIGIARAIYKNPSLIIFDEATSALDTKTEEDVMKSIYSLNKELTVLIISHRVTTLKDCDRVIKIEDKGIINVS